jgi:2-hydroxy-3-keto-5-methylthiopentenyl-1-phosphate phosphatase
MSKQKLPKATIICDFDGCLCYQDVFDEMMDHFVCAEWRNFGKSYEEGKISHSELVRRSVNLLRCLPYELEQFLFQKIEVRDGYKKFYKFCKELKIPLLIVSTGCDYYIRYILSKEPLYFLQSLGEFKKISTDYVGVIANHLQFNSSKKSWKVLFPWGEETDCFCRCSPCKAEITRYLKKSGIELVIGIGDGLSDRCMAHLADLVFARTSLKKYCKKNKIPFYGFDNFQELPKVIMEFLENNLSG